MRTPKFVLVSVAAVAALAAPVVFAGSHGGDLPAAVKARQAHMSLNGHNIGVLVPMMRGDVEYDAEAVEEIKSAVTTFLAEMETKIRALEARAA